MKISLPTDIDRKIATELVLGLSGNHRIARDSQALHAIHELAIDIARTPEIRDFVKRYLMSPMRQYRTLAARILDAIGDSSGALHLTYECLRTHPVTGQDLTKISGQGDPWLFDCIPRLTDECIELIVQDVRVYPCYLHADVLSALPAEKIVSRMLPLLSEPPWISGQAAYVLAMKGRDDGRAVLEKIAEDVDLPLLELALIGLSHIPNGRAIELIKGYASPHHPVYAAGRQPGWKSSELLTKSQQRLFMLEQGEEGFLELMNHFYLARDRARIESPAFKLPDYYEPNLFLAQYYTTTHTPDFLVEFSTGPQRKALAETQREGMLEFLRIVPEDKLASLNWPRFMLWKRRPRDSRVWVTPTSHYLEGVKVMNDEEDYLFAATDWLLNPQDYRLGSHRYLPEGLARPS